MAVLITGATGTIGRVLTASLIKSGLNVHVLTRRPHRAQQYFAHSVRAFEWHPVNEPVPQEALETVSTIVHLMGARLEGSAGDQRLQRLSASRIKSTERLVAACSGRDIRLILASSAGIYPAITARSAVDISQPLHEASPLNPGKAGLPGAIARWEAAARPFAEAGGSLVCVRLGCVIAADGFPKILSPLMHWRVNAAIDPAASIPVITLQDAVALFAWLIVTPQVQGVVNGVAPHPLIGDAINDLQADMLAQSPVGTLPRWAMTRWLGLEAGMILDRPLIAPRVALNQGFKFSHPDPFESFRKTLHSQMSRHKNTPTLPPVRWLYRKVHRKGTGGKER